jgi:hypothetical protein
MSAQVSPFRFNGWPMRKAALRISIAVVVLGGAAIFLALYQSGVFKPSVAGQLKRVSKGSEPAWYAGDAVAGLKLTNVATSKGRRVASFGYGKCHHHGASWNPFANEDCGYPLLIQTWRLDQGSSVSTDFIPTYDDGNCGRTTLRGVPAGAGSDGVVLYSGDEAIAVLGPGNLVREGVAALRRAGGGPGALPKPTTLARDSLKDCVAARQPLEPVSARLRRLLHGSELPLVTAGAWFQDGQLTNAEQVGKAITLEYESCRAGSPLGQCATVLSISVEPVNRTAVAGDLRGAKCSQFTTAGAPGIVWNNQLASGDAAGLYLFTGAAAVSMGKDFTLEHADSAKVKRAARALRPLAGSTLPKPAFDASRLIGLCAKTS